MPGMNIAIDETLVFFRGRSNMVFYMPAKPLGIQNAQYD